MATTVQILDSQHPDAKLDHALSFSTWLETGDTLNTVTASVSTGINLGDGSTAPAPAISGNDVVFWLHGGTSGQTYTGQVDITTAEGRSETVEWQITIIDPNS